MIPMKKTVGKNFDGPVRVPRKTTHESHPGDSLAQVVISPPKVKHSKMNTPQVVLRESFKSRQLVRQLSQAIQRSLIKGSWRRGRSGALVGEERV